MSVLTADYRKDDAPEVFTRSLRETGFGVLKNHPIDYELVKKVFAEWEEFFSRSDVQKEKYNFDPTQGNQDGFFPKSVAETAKGFEIKDIKEFYHFYAWGRLPEGLTEATKQLQTHMANLAAELLSWIEQHTPANIAANFSMPLSDMITDSPGTVLRILHYPPFDGSEEPGAVRAAAHEDINLITILPAATTTGLQVQDVHGNWVDVPCEPGTLAINTGDMLQMCSEGYYPATTHRVVNPTESSGNKSRLSMPLFLHPRPEVRLSQTHTAGEYLVERLRELGIYAEPETA